MARAVQSVLQSMCGHHLNFEDKTPTAKNVSCSKYNLSLQNIT